MHDGKWHWCACVTGPAVQNTKNLFGGQLHKKWMGAWVWQLLLISWISLSHQSGCRCAGVLGGVTAGRGERTCVSVTVAPKGRKFQFNCHQFVRRSYPTAADPSAGWRRAAFGISNSAKVTATISAIKNTISCVFRRRTNLAHELFVILDFLSWWPRKVNPCIAVHPMNTKYGWIKHFHSSHYYLISCLTELSVWSNPRGFATTRTGIIMTSGMLLGKYSKPEKSHRYFPSSFVWSITAPTLSINKSLLMRPACCTTCYAKHFASERWAFIFGGWIMTFWDGLVSEHASGRRCSDWFRRSILHATLVFARLSLRVHQLLPTLRQNDY